ncbi:MAG: hypothetical protein NTV54_16135 [Ignavibacteriales bacterium]|nr:hypothetical protein [Ignavibacteriales bacterium]
MENNESLLTKASDICAYINTLSDRIASQQRPQKKLIVSFDVYCLLLEYTALLNYIHQDWGTSSIEELIATPDLFYETKKQQLAVCVDFFKQQGSVDIE